MTISSQGHKEREWAGGINPFAQQIVPVHQGVDQEVNEVDKEASTITLKTSIRTRRITRNRMGLLKLVTNNVRYFFFLKIFPSCGTTLQNASPAKPGPCVIGLDGVLQERREGGFEKGELRACFFF